MSMLARHVLGAARELILVTGTLTGSGTLSIPAGCVLVTLTGQGGDGGDDSWYDPGQPYIAPTYSEQNVPHGHYGPVGTCSDTPGSWGPTNEHQATWTTQEYWSWDCPYNVTTSPGQPYIAPSSGGGTYTGSSTTATLNGITATFVGGYGGAAARTGNSLASTGGGQTLSYNVATPNGYLAYSYYY